MNFLREKGRSIQQDDNSYKFILIQKNNSTLTKLANSTSSTSNTSKHPNEDQQINLSKELANLKIQQQQNQNNNLNGKVCFYFSNLHSLFQFKAL